MNNKNVCGHCDSKIPEGKAQCPKCKKWTGTSAIARVDGSIMLDQVQMTKADRISTGPWDYCFGVDVDENGNPESTGIVCCSSNLLAGSPGAGKSTLALQILNASVPVTGREGLYIAAEEPLLQIRRRADRLRLKNQNRIRMVPIMTGDSNVEEVISLYKPGLMVVDSVNGIAGGDSAMSVKICTAIKQFCMRHNVPAIILSHINKGGEIAGLEALQHEVDATMTFFPEGETDDEESVRVLHVEKNRNGKAFISLSFAMTERGLVLVEESDDDDQEEEL